MRTRELEKNWRSATEWAAYVLGLTHWQRIPRVVADAAIESDDKECPGFAEMTHIRPCTAELDIAPRATKSPWPLKAFALHEMGHVLFRELCYTLGMTEAEQAQETFARLEEEFCDRLALMWLQCQTGGRRR